jgi:hypothetical protein
VSQAGFEPRASQIQVKLAISSQVFLAFVFLLLDIVCQTLAERVLDKHIKLSVNICN